jgi:Baseplate J-like protein
MPLPSPKLDDRTFDQLVAEAQQFIARNCPAWTDRSPHDPGTVLLEVFAYLTEVLLYRVNRIPEKAYVELLRLIGVKLAPPSAARATIFFSVLQPTAAAVVIPRGTQVATARPGRSGAPPTFTTAADATIPAGQSEASALAFHCEVIEGELVGLGTGLPGQAVMVKRPPIVAATGDDLDLVVAVEATPEELAPGVETIGVGEKVYRVWREVSRFAHAEDSDEYVYVADRNAGSIWFSPAVSLVDEQGAPEDMPRAHASVPSVGREIRVSYRRGGGPEGNVGAGEIATLKQPLRGAPPLTIQNREPAMGGRTAETVANAMLRGPEEIHSLRRAVTASDFEILARKAGGVARARALTQAELWVHGRPGTVEVVLVPELPPDVRGPDDAGVTGASLREHHSEATRAAIQADLNACQTVGTKSVVTWARTQTVTVKARIQLHRSADRAAVESRVRKSLYGYIDPLPRNGDTNGGWPFGAALPKSTLYHLIQSEPGVAYVSSLSFLLDEVPSTATALAADLFQPRTWYAGSGETLYRSMKDGDGWEAVGRFAAGARIEWVVPHPARAGILAVAARLPVTGGQAASSGIYRSLDCGETWLSWDRSLPAATDLAWILRDGAPVLLISTAQGLYELALDEHAQPLPVTVDGANANLPLHAVAAVVDARGTWMTAVAAQGRKGVYLSNNGARSGSFKPFGLIEKDVRRLEFQQESVRTRLWAGQSADSPEDSGRGAWVYELGSAEGWKERSANWDGGSCFALAFGGPTVYAATHHLGVLTLDSNNPDAKWIRPDLGCGLPLRSADRLLQPVNVLAARSGLVLAGGAKGVFRSKGDGLYENCSATEVQPDFLPLPDAWLFCSGPHQIEAVSE